jgi:hypothetical protein
MLQFEKLNIDNALQIKPFLQKFDYTITDNTLGCLFMWRNNAKTMFCIYKDCLILRENFDDNTVAFRYPVSLSGDINAEEEALSKIERYVIELQLDLNYCKLDTNRLYQLVGRYKDRICIKNTRYWRDYYYNAEDLKFFKGGKYSGQRNHINKFKKLYPNYQFKTYVKGDEEKLYKFLNEYSNTFNKSDLIAVEELEQTIELVSYIEKFDLKCGYLECEGKIIAFSLAEIFQDCLIIHSEKALIEYEGVYPLFVSEFAKHFCDKNIKYINREDDAGDLGLRRSKMQYKPIGLFDKLFIGIKRSIDELEKLPTLLTERLTLKEIEYENKREYNILSMDEELNKYWGYDYKKDLKTPFYDNYFVDVAKRDFEKRSVICLGVFLCGRLIGEVVLQYFDYFSGAEIGARICSKFAKKGYGREAIIAVGNWAMDTLNIEKLYSKCYKENEASRNMLLKSGMRDKGNDDTFYYFLKEN